MKTMAILMVILGLGIYESRASLPNIEGLFRNVSNPEVASNWISLKFQVEQLKEESVAREEQQIPDALEDSRTKIAFTAPKFVKYIFSLKNEDRINLLKIIYGSSQMQNGSIERVEYVENLQHAGIAQKKEEQALFNSVMTSLLFNRSEEFVKFFNKAGIPFSTNKEMMNREKLGLMEKYKKYLSAIKSDGELRENISSPLNPENEEQKARVNKIMASSMYFKSNNIDLVREDDRFYWQITLQNFKALFANETRLMKKIVYRTDAGETALDFGNYVLFDGVHLLPKTMIFKSSHDGVFRIRMLELIHLNKTKSMEIQQEWQKHQKILEVIKKNKESDADLPDDIFFL